LNISIFQSDAQQVSLKSRLQSLETVLSENSDQEIDLVLCPELFLSGYANAENIREIASAIDGKLNHQLAGITSKYGIAICCGYPELEADNIYNSLLYISAQGQILANHRKRVLPTDYEKELFKVGDQITVFDFDENWRIGLLICYESEFPEAVRACALNGVNLVLVSTALGIDWPVVSRQVIPTRAFENGVFLAYANYSGKDVLCHYIGDSVIVSPTGVDLARASMESEFISATLDLQAIDQTRGRLPYLQDFVKVSQ